MFSRFSDLSTVKETARVSLVDLVARRCSASDLGEVVVPFVQEVVPLLSAVARLSS